MARWKVWRYGSSTVVTVSITLALKSVFPRTRPSPGKCLAVVASPPWAMPRMNATPWLPTTAGVGPNSRISCPMGAFWLVSAAGTTSMTGAKLRLTPAARNSLPQVRARPRSPAGGSMPCATALGIVEKPGPCSAWTSPPSWLAATKNRVPPVACAEDSDCTAWGTEATPRPTRGIRGDEADRAEVVRPDRLSRGGVQHAARQPHHEQLPDPLGQGHPGQHPVRAGPGRPRPG